MIADFYMIFNISQLKNLFLLDFLILQSQKFIKC